MSTEYSHAFLDLDGTLLDESSAQPAEPFRELLDLTGRHQIKTYFATARGPYFVKRLVGNDMPSLHAVCFDGAWLSTPQGVEDHPLSSAALSDLVEGLEWYWETGKLYLNGVEALYSPVNRLGPQSSLYDFWQRWPAPAADTEMYQFYIRDLNSEQLAECREVIGALGLSCYTFDSNRSGLSGLLGSVADINKSHGIKRVLGLDRSTLQQAIMIGNGANDLGAFALDGLKSIATPDAIPELQARASLVMEADSSILSVMRQLLGEAA